jgi:rod shape-determining protein MreD
MRWGVFAGLLLMTYLLQVAVLEVVHLRWLDLFLTLALLTALLVPKHDGRIACWIIGLAQDLGSLDTLGIHAFTLGLTGWLVTYAREVFNTGVWWARLVALFVCAWPGQMLYLLHLYYRSGHGGVGPLGLIIQAAALALAAAAVATLFTSLPWFLIQRRRSFRRARRIR